MPTSLKPLPKNLLLDLLLQYASLYLASGGPTSRLEESLVRMGTLNGVNTEVFATPTGVFVTIQDPKHDELPQTALLRIKETGTNLGQLCRLETVYADLLERRINSRTALAILQSSFIKRNHYSRWQMAAAAFASGFLTSFHSYQKVEAALWSALITGSVWFLANRVLKSLVGNPLFTDFIGAFLTLSAAAALHTYWAPLSIEAYALGGIVMLVPGLALTTSIAELADQNLVSGTAKFMQAAMALLALGLAYLLFQQIGDSLGFSGVLQPVVAKNNIQWVSALTTLLNITCFGVIFRVPPKALVWTTLTGLLGWLSIQVLANNKAAAAAPFIAAVVVGVASLSFGKIFRMPSQLYSVPGIVAALPGMLALSSFRYFATGDQNSGIAFAFTVMITAVSIVFGLISARVPFVIAAKIKMQRISRTASP